MFLIELIQYIEGIGHPKSSYDFYDDGDVLYAPERVATAPSIVDIPNIVHGKYLEFRGLSYSDRVTSYVIKQFGKVELPVKKRVKGWCSWDTYFQHLDHTKVRKELVAATRVNRELDLGLEYMLVDHGYGEVGQLLTDKDMWIWKYIDEVVEAGLKPGIWINPFSVSEMVNLNYIESQY